MSALFATNTGEQDAGGSGGALTFATNELLEGSDITHTPATTDVTLANEGTYQILYFTDVSDSQSSSATVSCQLQNNGAEIEGTTSTCHIASTGNKQHLSGGAIVQASGGEVITLYATDNQGKFSNTTILVHRLA